MDEIPSVEKSILEEKQVISESETETSGFSAPPPSEQSYNSMEEDCYNKNNNNRSNDVEKLCEAGVAERIAHLEVAEVEPSGGGNKNPG